MITNQKVHQITDSDILDLQLILELLEKDECKFTLPGKSYRPINPTFSPFYPWSLYFDFNNKEFFFEYLLQKGLSKDQNRKMVLGDVKFIKKTYGFEPYINEWTYLHRITSGEATNTLFVVEGKGWFFNSVDKVVVQNELTRQNLMKVIGDSIKEKILNNIKIANSKKNFTTAQITTKNLNSKEVGKLFQSLVKDITNLRFEPTNYHFVQKQIFLNEEFFVKGYLNQTEKDKIKILDKIKRKNVIREIGLKEVETTFLIENHKSEFEDFIKRLREE